MIQYMLKTKKFIPHEFHQTFYDIDFEALYQKGYRLILTDLDNTLISYDEFLPNKKNTEVFQRLNEIGFEVILVSNNVPKRIDTYTEGTELVGFGNARKPLLIGMKKAFNSAKTTVRKDQVLFIGDQLMTDIYGAHRFGVYSILVNPIKRKTEKWYTKMNRKMEQKMLQKIKHKHFDIYQNLGLDKRG